MNMNDNIVQAQIEKRNTIISNAKRMIWVTFQKEGIHKYPGADTNPLLATGDEYDVSFLGHPHRHIFHFKVAIQVEHSNRAIEFIQFKRWLENQYAQGVLMLDNLSCEMLADNLYEIIAAKYPNRHVQIEVSEDGENGCSISYNA